MIRHGVANTLAVIAIALTAVAVAVVLQRPTPIGLAVAFVLAASVSIPLVGAAAVRSAARNPIGWMLLVTGIALPLNMAAHAARLADPDISIWIRWLDGWPATPAADIIPLLALQLYPTGRALSRRWNWLIVVGALVFVTQLLGELFEPTIWGQTVANPTALPGVWGAVAEQFADTIIFLPIVAVLSAVTATLRWRRSAQADRSSTPYGLIAIAGWFVAASWWACVVVVLVTGDSEAALLPELAALLAVGVACWIGIRRFGTFDSRTVIGRGVVAIVLGVCVLAVYLGVAWLVEQVVAGWLGPAIAVLAAVGAALPLWRLLQGAATRLLFGERDEPMRALEKLGARLAGAGEAEHLLPDAVEAIRGALRLPAVSLTAGSLRVGEVIAPDTFEDFPLLFGGETIGELRAAHRAPGERFNARERRSLTALAGQLAGVTRAVSLDADLRRSRERIVSERERERRRITRDLHDGLGARLGGLVLGIQRARGAVTEAPERASEQLDELTGQVRDALDEVRRLVYELRPPALDELGLVGAVEEQARRLSHVEVVAPAPIDGLPAAVEVAAYRIAIEAMTNASRHAPGAVATVTIDRTESDVELRISDRGPGMPVGFRAGVGIASMRERASELEGTLTISGQPGGGTLVRALLPVSEN
ncbi:hypothetical protein BH11ACT3_BH11ACT3_18740 [soil metagenome]